MLTIYNLSDGQEDMFLINIENNVRILIDSGNTMEDCKRKIKELNEKENNVDMIDYIVLTHIDQDHIRGFLRLLKDEYDDTVVIYNKFINGLISYKQAEKFEKLIRGHKVVVSYKEYQDNFGDVIFLSPEQRRKYKIKKEEIYITFLNPPKEKIEELYQNYQYYKKTGKKMSNDTKVVNGSSIIFILEYDGKAILMSGDGYIADIIPFIEILSDEKKTYCPINKLDLIKIPHHGSKDNNEKLDKLLEKMNCNKFIITNGDKGNVKIENGLKEILKDKEVYASDNCDKYGELTIKTKCKITI